MMQPFDFTICRTPAFSIDDNLNEVWDVLKEKIKDSSPYFYNLIADKSVDDLSKLDEKVQFTIWKYLNRSKFRATPFGSFAAIAIVPLLKIKDSPIKISSGMAVHTFRDWTEKAGINSLLSPAVWLHSNSSIYYIGNEIRYIRLTNGQFELASVSSFPQLAELLKLCSSKISKTDAYKIMQARFKMQKGEITDLLQQMINLQLLQTDISPNITGEDYFTRINQPAASAENSYEIAERSITSGHLDHQQLRDVQELIDFLVQNLDEDNNAHLDTFRISFVKKFGVKEIPLSTVMDPEMGIGYGNLESLKEDNTIIQSIKLGEDVKGLNTSFTYTELHAFILNNIIGGKPIKLDEFKALRRETSAQTPNTLSVLMRFWNGQPVIERAGGCTANALLGRFTLANKELERCGKQISLIEERANPGVIFFDIAYQAESNVDNVNRRKLLYKQELPILTWSCLDDPLTFDDILVSVKGEEVVLRSKKHQKRLVPRLASAYNYTRSDLAAYRFLCDLQRQGLKTDLSFRLSHYFPNLEHYPRVTFKSVIVSPAMWLMPKAFGQYKTTTEKDTKRNSLLAWLKEHHINAVFTTGDADKTLCFDPESENDIDAFLFYCKQKASEDFYISEALIAKESVVADEQGKKYAGQFIVNYFHEETLYQKFPRFIDEDKEQAIEEVLLPGSDWLYFEIFCHQARSNDILLKTITPFLQQNKQVIKKWFFIRYNDPAPHLRLRIQLKQSADGFDIIKKFKDANLLYIKLGLISDFSIKTYRRELIRYGAGRIDLIENLFYINSKYVSSLLRKGANSDVLYVSTIHFIKDVYLTCFDCFDEQIAFVKNVAHSFAHEMQMTGTHFKKINEGFKDLKRALNQEAKYTSHYHTNAHRRQLINILQTCTTLAEKNRLLADIIHMHINRVFIADQRIHEAVVYHHLLKYLQWHHAYLSLQEECLVLQ